MADGGVMDVANDWVDFVPEPSQLARVNGVATIRPADAPPVWVAIAAVAAALGLSLSLALPPATKVKSGAVTAERVETAIER